MASSPEASSVHLFSDVGREAHPQAHRPYSILKRLVDIALVVITLPVTVPLIAILALCVRLEGGKAFYCQSRVGRNGRLFAFWKLRTMVPDAEQRLDDYLASNPAARAEWDLTQKLKDDPRITRLGRFLRKCSADELPQLWNVLRGDMSLVGPRPMLPEQRPLYPGAEYFALRPGMTGSWQISDRNEGSFANRALFDAEYAKSMSLSVDMAILFRTVGVVVRGTGW
jgi:lipopolysaccharide/colanic/teichoic acid biosynthesis glycosyltransferase